MTMRRLRRVRTSELEYAAMVADYAATSPSMRYFTDADRDALEDPKAPHFRRAVLMAASGLDTAVTDEMARRRREEEMEAQRAAEAASAIPCGPQPMTPDEFRACREAIPMKPAQLAVWLGVSRMTVWRYESGRYPIPGATARLMRGAGISLSEHDLALMDRSA